MIIADTVFLENTAELLKQHHLSEMSDDVKKDKRRKQININILANKCANKTGVFRYLVNMDCHFAIIDYNPVGQKPTIAIIGNDNDHILPHEDSKSIIISKNEDMVFIASDCHSSHVVEAGAVFIFQKVNEKWVANNVLTTEDIAPFAHFGQSMILSKDETKLFVSAPGKDGLTKSEGCVYVYEVDEDAENDPYVCWNKTFEIKPTDPKGSSYFGEKMVISSSGKHLLVSAPLYDDTHQNEGRVYSFYYQNGTWVQEAVLKAPVTHDDQEFGKEIMLRELSKEIRIEGTQRNAVWYFKMKEHVSVSFEIIPVQ